MGNGSKEVWEDWKGLNLPNHRPGNSETAPRLAFSKTKYGPKRPCMGLSVGLLWGLVGVPHCPRPSQGVSYILRGLHSSPSSRRSLLNLKSEEIDPGGRRERWERCRVGLGSPERIGPPVCSAGLPGAGLGSGSSRPQDRVSRAVLSPASQPGLCIRPVLQERKLRLRQVNELGHSCGIPSLRPPDPRMGFGNFLAFGSSPSRPEQAST